MEDSKTLRQIDAKLTALLALVALSLTGDAGNTKLEVLLKETGLDVSDIVKILGKKEDAIRKAISRAKK